MKPIALLILTSLYSIAISAQTPISAILNQPEILTPQYEIPPAGCQVLYLSMTFGGSTFSDSQKDAIKILRNAAISHIDLVYSDYPAGTDFSPLTQRRLQTLQAALPSSMLDKSIVFKKIRQTSAPTKALATELQHGFFIYFRPLPTKGSGKKEVGKLTDLLSKTAPTPTSLTETAVPPVPLSKRETPPNSIPETEEMPTSASTDTLWYCSEWTVSTDTTDASLPPTPPGYTRTISRIAVKDAVTRKLINKSDEKEYLASGDSTFFIETIRDGGCEFGDYRVFDAPDSTVTSVFKRHRWSHAMVIADVTGSMYPYTAQLLKWLQLNLTNAHTSYFIFFNDGDDKDDDKKIIGSTGGIYPVVSNNYDQVERTIKTAMTNGSGGDAPENNIEALIASEKLCNNCDSMVMIADNWAPVKDMALLPRWHKPVKVVVCGVFDKINPDYLKIARDTKGSLHLMEEDIYTLSALKEGETIKIHGVIYKLVDGNFVDVSGFKKAL
jgi:hypothetical protein